MKYLLDSDWVISFLNGRAQAVELVVTLAPEGIALSTISLGEIFEGLLASPDPDPRLEQLERFGATLDLLAPDSPTALAYARIRAGLRARGQLLADNDLWIAATALAHDLTLVSRDRHFERIEALRRYGART
jgi:tRNA(fMet)-specific endonuclease VapC